MSDDFSTSDPRTDACHTVLRQVFGHTSYKGQQKEIVEAAVQGQDVFVLAPTGMGKSLCFQIPAAAATSGITIVVSPLLALMKNQLQSLRKKGVPVVSLTSETPAYEREEIHSDLSSGDPEHRLLYVTPEKMGSGDFLRKLREVYNNERLNRLVVDEAHCISEWGHDFRGDYRKLGYFREKFPGVPIMALTATATSAVQEDIIRSLRMEEGNELFRALHPFNRGNLFYEVRYISEPGPSQFAEIHTQISTWHQRRGKSSSGIVYCRTRATCNDLSGFLRGKGMSVRPYHKGIPPTTLDKTLTEWTQGDVDVVIATIAFGLGIDKGDVRWVIHYDVPKSFEGYYQETGRAGRNGSPARCVLYYSREDVSYVRRLVSGSQAKRAEALRAQDEPPPSQRSVDSLSALVKFAENTDVCRHITICRYFGEIIDDSDPEVVKSYCGDMCDVCKYPERTRRRKQALSPYTDDVESARAEGKTGWGAGIVRANSASSIGRTNSTSSMKRPAPEQVHNQNKKHKVEELPPAMVTKPFNSVSILKKPFKSPFLQSNTKPTPASVTSKPTVGPHPPITSKALPPTRETEISQRDGKKDEEQHIVAVSSNSSKPIAELPNVEIGLEEEGSNKIPNQLRKKGFASLRLALHTSFSNQDVWNWFQSSRPRDKIKEAEFLAEVARDLEYLVLTFSSTVDGYEERVRRKIGGVERLLKAAKGKNDDDEVAEVVQCVKDTLKL